MNKYWVSILAALALSNAAWAEGGNVAAGKDKAEEACVGCHGDGGNSDTPIFPKIAGQHVSFLRKELHDFRESKRVDPSMNAMTEALSDQDIEDLAAYFAGQKVRPESPADSPLGRRIYLLGNAEKGLPSCSACHGPAGAGNGPGKYPALAGQHAAYITKVLEDFKTGHRGNDKSSMMRTIASKLSEDEMNAVADYISGLAAER